MGESDAPDAPSGWYPKPDEPGVERFWDGSAWTEQTRLTSPPPQAAIVAGDSLRKARLKAGGWLLLVVALLAAIFAVTFLVQNKDNAASSDYVTSDENPGPAPSSKPSLADSLDSTFAEAGLEVVESGETYFQFAPDGEFTCGYYACQPIYIYSVSGCSGGFYVKVDLLTAEGTPVGWTNAISASVQPNEMVSVMLEDVQGIGQSMRVSEINCMF